MRSSSAFVTAVVVLSTTLALASGKGKGANQTQATSPLTLARAPEPEPEFDLEHVEDGAGPRASFGRALHRDFADGWYGRFETEYFEQHSQGRRRRGPLWGMRLGLEGWGSSDGGGAGVPVSGYWGYRQPLFRTDRGIDLVGTLGVGVDIASVDRVCGQSAVGLLTPRGEALLGFDFGGVRLLAELGGQVRWHFAQEDFVQLRAGIALGLHSELWDG